MSTIDQPQNEMGQSSNSLNGRCEEGGLAFCHYQLMKSAEICSMIAYVGCKFILQFFDSFCVFKEELYQLTFEMVCSRSKECNCLPNKLFLFTEQATCSFLLSYRLVVRLCVILPPKK